MTDQALIPDGQEPPHLAPLTPLRRKLVEAMVWDGLTWAKAAQHIGMSERRARDAIRHPDVLKALRNETQVLRASVKPRAISQLVELGEQRKSMSAAVMANKALLGDEEASRASININITPGYVIDLTDKQRPLEGVTYEEVIRVDDVQQGGEE